MKLKIEGELGREVIYCPKCNKNMLADRHGPKEYWINEKAPSTFNNRIMVDNWICFNCDIIVARDDFMKDKNIIIKENR